MNPRKSTLVLVLAIGLAPAGGLRAQAPAAAQPQSPSIRFPLLPKASPICTNIQRVGFTDIRIVYSRPNMKGHTVFGGIVPYGSLWRTGDNASTKISFSTPVRLGGADGADVPAGNYALFTTPGEKLWTVIFNKEETGGWGTDNYDHRKDVAQFQVPPVSLRDPVESFTIDVSNIQDDSAVINLSWGRVRVSIKVETGLVPDLLIKIKASMDSPERKTADTYLQAATFYMDHAPTKDLDQALLWVASGLALHQANEYQLLYVRAKILARSGDAPGAKAAAQQSFDLARTQTPPDMVYLKMDQEIISNPR